MSLPVRARDSITAEPKRLAEPHWYRSMGKWHAAQMYVIGWPEGIVKVGSTFIGRQRWGKFLSRGGTMLDIAYFKGSDDIYAETWMQHQLDAIYDRAFRFKQESLPYLGDGCGYTECYLVPQDEWDFVVKMARAL